MYYFDPKNFGFYLQGGKGLIKLSYDDYCVLIDGQSEGNVITIGDDGKPCLVPLEKTPADILAAANAQRDSLLAVAGLRIAPLQDAVDLESATGDDKDSLKLWKQYRVAVNRVTDQPKYPNSITWPAPPGE
ncbi:tail fiber assembly protein [Pseudomonas sp. D47]|uniref:tail fiber assembly protein n=1 Tax=Pseudomonas sp. D47 TaxID=3159447 RepID=UPI00387AA225